MCSRGVKLYAARGLAVVFRKEYSGPMMPAALPIACRLRPAYGRSVRGAAVLAAWLGVTRAAYAEPSPLPPQPGRVPALAQPLPAATRWTPTHGERELVFRLSDESGAPVRAAAADLTLRAAPGVELAPVTAAAAGTFRSHLRWPAGLAELALRVELPAPAAAIPIELDPAALEPPPSPAAPPSPPPAAPPRPPPVVVSRPPPAPRVGFELGLAGAALLNRGVYGLGGGVDVGASFRLPFGAISAALRLALEQHIQPEPAPFLLNFGLLLTYRIGRPRWRLTPYVGLWTQGILQRTPDALGAIPLQRSESGLVLGGLGGAQLRLWRGGLFTELGYRGAVYRQTAAAVPAWNTAFLLLGYRISTN